MAKIIQIIDVDSEGHRVRLDDGRFVFAPHSGEGLQLGHEFIEIAQPVSDDAPEPEPAPQVEAKCVVCGEPMPAGNAESPICAECEKVLGPDLGSQNS